MFRCVGVGDRPHAELDAGDLLPRGDREGVLGILREVARQVGVEIGVLREGRALDGRDELEAATERIAARFPEAVPLPPFWGGYRLVPAMFEFWQGRRDRMHDRFSYLREGDGWRIERLAP